MAASVALILWLTREMTFLQDTWDLLINRRDPTVAALLEPHNEHIVLIPALLEIGLLRLFGMESARPEFVVLALALAVAAALLFVYVRRRVGPWPALCAAVVLLFLGPAWEALLWPFEIGFVGSVLFGLAMLIALDRDDERGDLAACGFLLLSFGFSSVALPFAAAAAVDVLQKRRARGLARAYLAVVPVALYGAWYLAWGSSAETHVTLANILGSPRFAVDSAAVAVGAVSGLGANPVDGSPSLDWGRALLVALVVGFGVRAAKGWRPPAGIWPIAAAAAANWLLTAFNQMPGRDPSSSRYQYMGAVLVLLLLANLLQGVRIRRPVLLALGVGTLAIVSVNVVVLEKGRDNLEHQSILTRGGTAAIEIARATVSPDFSLSPEVAGTTTLVDVRAGEYLAAIDEYGSPAYDPDRLAAAPEVARRQADIVLAQALPLSTVTYAGAFERAGGGENCVAARGREVIVHPGLVRIEVAPGRPAAVSLRRFAREERPVSLESAPGGSVVTLEVPRDAAQEYPWRLRADAAQLVRVCR